MTKKKNPKDLLKKGRPTTYKPEYCQMIVDFFSPPYYTIKDICITVTDNSGTKETEKTEMEALPPRFLSQFATSIGVSLLHYRQTFKDWAEINPDFSDALKEAKNLEEEMIRTNAQMGLYSGAFSIFTMKNIAGWRDKTEVTGADGKDLPTNNTVNTVFKIDFGKATDDELVGYLQAKTARAN